MTVEHETQKTFMGDQGTIVGVQVIELDDNGFEIPVDLTGIVDVVFHFIKPNGKTVLKKNSEGDVIILDPLLGEVYYITEPDFWDHKGTWKVTVEIVYITGSSVFYGDTSGAQWKVYKPGEV